jgi:sortase A
VITYFHTNTPERISARAVRLAACDPSATREDVLRVLQADPALNSKAANKPTIREAPTRPPVPAAEASENGFPSAALRRRARHLHILAAILVAAGLAFAAHGLYIRAKAMVAQMLLEQAWQTTLATGKPTKAWSWADTHPIARITFPRLGRAAIVLAEGGGEALAFGPAHVAASPLPGGNGVSVIAGHRDTHFTFIKDLKPGDEIIVATKNGTSVSYHVTGSAIVHAQSSGIATTAKTPRLALVTCYPFDGLERGPLRYVVFAQASSPNK